jgi:hypothetical protein
MTSAQLISEHADMVERLDGSGQGFSLTWHAGDTREQRTGLIDYHGAVIEELRRRGRTAQGAVVRDEEDTEHYAIRVVPDDE